jgi:hypothetical protein
MLQYEKYLFRLLRSQPLGLTLKNVLLFFVFCLFLVLFFLFVTFALVFRKYILLFFPKIYVKASE